MQKHSSGLKQLILLLSLPLLLVGKSSAQSAVGTDKALTLSIEQVGKANWPFNREEVMLMCHKDGAMYIINPSTLQQYPLNEQAKALAKQQWMHANELQTILQASSDKLLANFIAVAEQRCTQRS